MDELAERIKASLENTNSEPWFPELTADLAARALDSLVRDIGLKPDSYGTERVLSRSVSAPREIIASLKICTSTSAAPPAIAIEGLTPDTVIKYQKQGVNFYSADEILHTTILSCLRDALAIINHVPSLMRTVAALVRSLHVIKAEDADYDVSFSEPHVPFSIFVSVPQEGIANDALRVAEAIVHEAMHLQLTLIEEIVQLSNSTLKEYYSPWRGELRNAEGIFQALFVFTTIDRFLTELLSSKRGLSLRSHIVQRRSEIKVQIQQVQSFRNSAELTEVGSRLTARLIDVNTQV